MILALLSTISLVSGEGAPQAQLHPQNSDLYFEAPDLPKLIAAYGEAPMVQLFHDEEVRATAALLMESFEAQIAAALDQAARQSGQSAEDLLALPERALDWLQGIQSISGSMSGLIEALGQYEQSLANWREVWDECARLQAGMDRWLSDGGAKPENVAVIPGLDEELARDPWGRVYLVVGDTARVSSAGPTGDLQSSPLARRWSEGASSYELEELLQMRLSEEIGVSLLVRFTAPEPCQELAERLLVLAARGGLAIDNGSLELGGVEFDLRQSDIEVDGTRIGTLWMASGETMLAFGFGSNTPEQLSERMQSAESGTSLATDPTFIASREGLVKNLSGEGPEAGLMFQRDGVAHLALKMMGIVEDEAAHLAKLEVEQQITFPVEFPVEQALGGLPGLVEVRSISKFGLSQMGGPTPTMGVNRLVQGRFHSDSWTTKAGEAFFDDIIDFKPVDTSHVSLVPEDSLAVRAFSVDWEALVTKTKAVLASEAPEVSSELESALDRLEQAYGVDLEGQLVASLGTSIVGYLQPPLLGLPDCGLVIELTDAQTFETSVATLGALLSEQTGGAFEMDSRPYSVRTPEGRVKVPIWTLKRTAEPFGSSGLLGEVGPQVDQVFRSGFAPTPSFAVFGDTAVLGLTTMHTKHMVKRWFDEERLEHPLLNLPIPDGVQSLGYMDWAGLWMSFYSMGLPFLKMMGDNLPIQASDLPAREDIEQYFEPTISWKRRGDGGTWRHKVSSFGPEVVAMPLTLGLVSTLFSPAMVQLVEHAGPDMTSATGNTISVALDSYAIFNDGEYPSTLAELEASEHWSDFFSTGQEGGMRDSWGRPFRYEVDGASVHLWSMGPNGFDEDGSGDDIVLRSPGQRGRGR